GISVIQNPLARVATKPCVDWSRSVLEALHEDKSLDLVLFHNITRIYEGESRGGHVLFEPTNAAEVFQGLMDAGRKVAVVRSVPRFIGPGHAPDCIAQARTA